MVRQLANLQQASGRSRMLLDAFTGSDMRSIVPFLHSRLRPPPQVIIKQCRTYFNAFRREKDPNLAVENLKITAEATTDDGTDVQKYGGTCNVSIQRNITGGRVLDE